MNAIYEMALQVVVVGLGSRQNAMLFSKLLDFPLRLLYAGEALVKLLQSLAGLACLHQC